MKRILLLSFLLFALSAISTQAQTVLFSEDFENGLGEMTSIDVDGLAVNPNLNLPSEWSVIPLNNGDNVAASPSWFASAARADDWMITPAIAIEPGTVLEWNAAALSGNFPDGYNVLVSTTDMELENFETVFSLDAENPSFTDRLIDLGDYAGMTIHIAFQNNTNDGVAIALDDILVRTTKAIDVRVPNLSISNTNFLGAGYDVFTGLAGNKDLVVEMFNAGSDAFETIEITYSIGGQQYTDMVDVNVPLGETYTFFSSNSHNYEIGDGQPYSVDRVVINGEEQAITESNVINILPPVPAYEATDSKGGKVNVHELLADGKTVILDFFASWCGPCQQSTPMLNAWYEANESGAGNLEVLGIDIEETDTDDIVNGLGWGATYPKISYKPQNELYWIHFTRNHDLNEGFIPFFLMLCPNPGDVSDSELNVNLIGVPTSGSFDMWQPNFEDCIARFVDVEDIDQLESITVFPNPTAEDITVNLEFGETTDYNLSVTSVSGKLVKNLGQFSGSDLSMNVDVSDLQSGVYILQVQTSEGQRNHRFMKM